MNLPPTHEAPPAAHSAGQWRDRAEFFLPDMCNVQSVLVLLLVAELLALVLELAARGMDGIGWTSLALTSMFVQWCTLFCAALLCQLRPRLAGWPLASAATTCYGLIVAVVAVVSLLSQWMLDGAFSGSGLWRVEGARLLTHTLIGAVLAGISLRYFYLAQQLRLKQQAELKARIQALQSRIRPHFLFNSMNIIASLIAIDQQAAEQAVEDLAALFRASLAETVTEVPLSQELEWCERYVRIEQLRLGARLQVEWQLQGVPMTLRIPALSLQPLLENAIYHGIQLLPEGGKVTVYGRYEAGELLLSVANPVPAGRAPTTRGNRIAHENIHQRLQALYGPRAGLTTQLSGDQHTATIRYPVA